MERVIRSIVSRKAIKTGMLPSQHACFMFETNEH